MSTMVRTLVNRNSNVYVAFQDRGRLADNCQLNRRDRNTWSHRWISVDFVYLTPSRHEKIIDHYNGVN